MISEATVTKQSYKVVGTRPIRHDGIDKVTGKAQYGADIHPAGLLCAKVLRSPHAHANIKSVDISRAAAHRDVKAVITHADLATVGDRLTEVGEDLVMSEKYLSNNILAEDKALYKGHAIAAIAATSVHAAEEALELIDVQYEVLPAVTNVEAAMKPGAPILHEHIIAPDEFGEVQPAGSNIAGHGQQKTGDVEKGFAEADVIVEREFRTSMVHQGYIEPHSATAWWGQDGRLTIWCSSQGHFGIQANVAKILALQASDIKVVPMEIGGGFGGKMRPYLEPIVAVLSQRCGKPVKATMTRAEELEATGPASGSYVKLKMGATRDGRITAGQAFIAFESGAYPGSSHNGAATSIFSPYQIENIQTDSYDIVDNKPSTSAYRAPGAPIGAFAGECVVDELARRLEMDPIEFRLFNAAYEGTRMASGVVHPRIGAIETMEAIRSHPHYTSPNDGKLQGRGVALGSWGNGAGPACVVANVHASGKVSLVEGSPDIGGTRTAIAQQFAEVLGIPVEDVNPQVADTDTIGYTSNTGGSSATFKSGWAAREAALDVKRQFIERAAILWETTVDQIEYDDGSVVYKGDPDLSMTFKELAGNLMTTGGPVVGRANVTSKGAARSFSANLVDVEVDQETGKVDIVRLTAFQDAGTAIHPSYVEGQIQGGAVQGVGWALNEEYFMGEEGSMLNSSFLDYRMPTSLDLPMIDSVIIEVPNPGHPYGIRGVGEANIIPPMAAIANAICDATGVRMTELPMTPASVVKAMASNGKTASS